LFGLIFAILVKSWIMNEILMSFTDSYNRDVTSWKSPGFFFAVLESPWILFIRPGKFLKIFGRFLVVHWDRIVKLLSLSTKN